MCRHPLLCCVVTQATLNSLVGLGLVYLACSWLLIYLASAFTSARRDLNEHRRMTKCSSAGDGLYTSSGGSTGSSGSATDAAIDIQADDSPSAYKADKAGVVRTRSGFPFMQVVAADARGERDVAPRLPFV
jgi:hypothetical protein